MMKLFDTHCHISDPKFDEDRSEVIAHMKAEHIEKAIVVGDATGDGSDVLALSEQNDFLYMAYGLHPHDASKWCPEIEKRIVDLVSVEKNVAIGEIGLDYHYVLSPRDTQRAVFQRQLYLAHEMQMPVILHIREAHGDAYEILHDSIKRGISVRGVMHCYGGSLESATEYIKMGLFISFSGSLTFKNTPVLSRVAENIPLDSILIETDSPYMAPVPMRGKRNEPCYVRYVCEKLAALRNMPVERIAEITFENGCRAFGI